MTECIEQLLLLFEENVYNFLVKYDLKPREMDQGLHKLRRAKFGWISLAETQTKCLARLTFTTYMQANIEDAQDSSGVIQHWLKWIIFWLKDYKKFVSSEILQYLEPDGIIFTDSICSTRRKFGLQSIIKENTKSQL